MINAVLQLLQNPGADYFLCLRTCLYLYMNQNFEWLDVTEATFTT